MAYAAVVSVKQTIQRLLKSRIVSSTQEILEFAYNEAKSLQEVLRRLDDRSNNTSSQKLNALDGGIRDEVYKLEDVLESYEEDGFPPNNLFIEINSFAETVKKMKEEYVQELDKYPLSLPDHDIAAAASPSSTTMVRLSDEFRHIKDDILLIRTRPDDFALFSIVGIEGSGRSLVAATIYYNFKTEQEESFECGAWVEIGPNPEPAEILEDILAQIGCEAGNGDLYACLKGRRYIILLDDVWDSEIWDLLRSSFPDESNGSLVLMTTPFQDVAMLVDSFCIFELQSMDDEFCWEFLYTVIFGVEPISAQVEEAGKKIAKNCEHRHLAMIKVAIFILMNEEETSEWWKKVAADEENSIFKIVNEISEVPLLLPTYTTRANINFSLMCEVNEYLQLCRTYFMDNDRITSATKVLSDVMLEFHGTIQQIKKSLFPKRLFPKAEIISFMGMAGIGKTTLVKEIFEDPSISCSFDHHVWVTLGPKYQSEDIVKDILAQILPHIDTMDMKGNVEDYLCTHLSDKKCLIVLDDLWKKDPLYYMEKLLSNIKGKVLVTTRLAKVAKFDEFDRVHEMQLLNAEQSWCLLREKVFPDGLYPLELEKMGRQIAENCDGLPLTIVKVSEHLSKAEKSLGYWEKVAKKQNSVFMDVYKEISKVLILSYNSLPQYIKPCFLYMGVFRQNYEIRTSKLIQLWTSEGFLEPNQSQKVQDFVVECLSELVDRSLLMVCRKSSEFGIKTCRLHSIFWHLSNIEAAKSKFFHVFDTYGDVLKQEVNSKYILCIRNNILFSIKDMQNSMDFFSTIRSLLCMGSPHQYPIQISLGLRLLRVLDALTIHFYEFPVEIVKLVHLRYLAITSNFGELPTSISKLCNLQFLIIQRHVSIKSSQEYWSYLPMEIWDMKELKHLQIMGSSLPNPGCGALLPNLVTLLGVGAHNLTKRILARIPNLKRLGIQVELAPDGDDRALCCLNRISCLRKLESLKCVIVNPELIMSNVVSLPAPARMFPSVLKKLSLNGLGYPWEYMSIIGELQNLEVLKLRLYAFRGVEWKTNSNSFSKLRYLLVEDTDLVRWNVKMTSLSKLKHLSIKNCYNLEELPMELPQTVEMIEVVDCNPATVNWANQIKDAYWMNPLSFETLKVQIHSSWD